jgi:hypothetical protein
MDQKKFRDIFGVVVLPVLTVIFFIFGALWEKQGLFVTGSLSLVTSLVFQFLITRD